MAIDANEFLLKMTNGLVTANSLAMSYSYVSDNQVDLEGFLANKWDVSLGNVTKAEAEAGVIKSIRKKPLTFTLGKNFENGSYDFSYTIGLDTSASQLIKYSLETYDLTLYEATWEKPFSAIGSMYVANLGLVKSAEDINNKLYKELKEDLMPYAIKMNVHEYGLVKLDIDASTNKPIKCIYAKTLPFLNQSQMPIKDRLLIQDSLGPKSIEELVIDARTKTLTSIEVSDLKGFYDSYDGIFKDDKDVKEVIYHYNNLEDLSQWTSLSLVYDAQSFYRKYTKH